jgi:hypothetical protein
VRDVWESNEVYGRMRFQYCVNCSRPVCTKYVKIFEGGRSSVFEECSRRT